MLNTNNKINIEKKERKYSWSTVFAWLFLKTIGRILPKRWNKWAENILYYGKATRSNEIRTDGLKTTDSVKIDLKPEVAVKESKSEIIDKDEETTFKDMAIQTDSIMAVDESVQIEPEVAEKENQSEVISKDGGVQTDGVAFQDTAVQTECVDRNIEANLKPEVAEKGSQSEIMGKDGEVQTEENSEFIDESCFSTRVNGEFIDENYDSMEEISTEEEDISLSHKIERSQNFFLKEEIKALKSKNEELEREKSEVTTKNEQLKLQLAEYEKDYTELKEVSDQIEKKLSVELEEKEVEENLVVIRKKDEKISSLARLNEASEQDIKKIKTENNEQQQIAKIYMKLNESLLNVIEISEKTLQLNNQEQQEVNKRLTEQKGLVEQLQKEQKQVEDQLKANVKKLQGEKENMEEQLKIMQQQLLNNQERQKMGEELKDVDKRLKDIDEKTKRSQEQAKVQRKPLQDKKLEHFLSDRNTGLKKDFPEFKEKNFPTAINSVFPNTEVQLCFLSDLKKSTKQGNC